MILPEHQWISLMHATPAQVVRLSNMMLQKPCPCCGDEEEPGWHISLTRAQTPFGNATLVQILPCDLCETTGKVPYFSMS